MCTRPYCSFTATQMIKNGGLSFDMQVDLPSNSVDAFSKHNVAFLNQMTNSAVGCSSPAGIIAGLDYATEKVSYCSGIRCSRSTFVCAFVSFMASAITLERN